MSTCCFFLLCATLFNPDDPPAKTTTPQRPAPNEEFRVAYVEMGTQLMDQRKKWLDEKDQQKKNQIMKNMIGTMAKKLLPLVRKYPEARESFAFLMECAAAGHDEGVDLLIQLHDKTTRIGDTCISMCMQSVAMRDRLCQTVLDKSKNPENRGRAYLAVGYWLKKDADATAERGDLDQARKKYRLAELRLHQASEGFGDIKIDFGGVMGKPTIKTLAERSLHEIKSLTVGQAAPELIGIDLEGKPLTLKEHQGKVVMVSFWAHWCGPCIALVPHERELVERFKGKPFVLLGVNGDELSKELVEKTKALNVTWRSFQNQPDEKAVKHSEKWNVMTWPTVYLIDHQGVIRKKWIGRVDPKQLDEAIETLVKEAEKGTR